MSRMWFGESAKSGDIAQKGVRAIEAERTQPDMAELLPKPVFALLGCQQISLNTLLCDALGLWEGRQVPTKSLFEQ